MNNKAKKITTIICMILISMSFSGCFNYKDINKVLFVTTTIVDVDEQNNPVIYIEAFKANIGKEDDTRILFKGTGKTLFEAIRDISLMASYKLNYTQNKAVIITKKAMEYGSENFIDILERDQEMILKTDILVYDGNAEQLINANLNEEKYIGIYIMQLIDNIQVSSRAINKKFNEYVNQRLIGDKVNVVPIIHLRSDVTGKKIKIEGGAVIKDDKLIGTISKNEGQGLNFLMDKIIYGSLEPENPQVKDKFVSLEILKSKTDTDLKIKDGRIQLIKKIRVDTSIAEVQDMLEINNNNIKALENTTEDNIKKACNYVFDKYKDMGIDIFNIQEEIYRRYPKAQFKDVIKNTDLILDVNVKIEGSGDNSNLKK